MTESEKYAEFDAMIRAQRRSHYVRQLVLIVTFGAFLTIIYGLATFHWTVLGGGIVALGAAYGFGILDRRRAAKTS